MKKIDRRFKVGPKQPKGISVAVSPRAHKKMMLDALKVKPRRNLREQINFINNLPIEL